MDTQDKRTAALKSLLERLHDPLQLRVTLVCVLLVGAYFGLYMPFSTELDETTRAQAGERKRLDLARDIEELRSQYKAIATRVARKPEATEWMRWFSEGSRQFPQLKVMNQVLGEQRELGPFAVGVLRVELEGNYADTHAFLRWLETNDRLIRIDELTIRPHASGSGFVSTNMTVLGLLG